ncbi:MAG: glycine cleavage T C-terminal barrel domain-containing protein [Leptolyngbyaceae cyanobacterium]
MSQKLCYLTLDDPTAVVMGKEPVIAEGKVVGYATSAGYGYSLGRCVVYAYLPLGYTTPGTAVTIEYFGQSLHATVVANLL